MVVLSVARLVEKKGTDVLLDALARLPAGLHWRLVHVGGGPLKQPMQRRARRLGIAPRITWRGALAQDELVLEYRDSARQVATSRLTVASGQVQVATAVSTAMAQIMTFFEQIAAGVRLSERDEAQVLAAAENPPAPNEAALQAARRFMQRHG